MDLDAAYQISNDTYVDARSGVLKNRLGLTDPDALEAAEEDITYAAIAALLAEQPYQLEQIDFETLRDIHRRVFGRIYAWAGELRTVEISKGNTRFAFSQWLQRAADNFGLPLSTFVLKAAQQVADSGELVIKADLTPT
ncbi:MAG: Fic family protein, partial [Bifidobacteriaceae bacterium]|nr:Fic family protein [Bifidobacteriaceae bacterium]